MVSLELMRGFGVAVVLCFACSLPCSSVTASRAIWEPSTSSSGASFDRPSHTHYMNVGRGSWTQAVYVYVRRG